MSFNDDEILSDLMLGKEEAFRTLFDHYYMPLCIYSVQITDSFDISEDIVQDFFVAFWEKKLYKQVKVNLQRYLFYCVRNASWAALKNRKILFLEELEEEAYSLPDEKLDEEELSQREAALCEVLRQLPEQCHQVFQGIILDGKKYKEVAEELNISVNSVKTQLSRALKRLRGSMDSLILLLLLKNN